MYIVELTTRDGPVSERYDTYEEARRRVEQFPGVLLGLPMIFQELPDGSERLVRADGKPLQFHRRIPEEERGGGDEPLPLAEGTSDRLGPDGNFRFAERRPTDDADDDPPIPLA